MKSSKAQFSHDLHLHLFGCLTAEDLWNIGKARHRHCEPQMQWYAQEYTKAYGIRPPIESFWQDNERAFKQMRDHYELKSGVTFNQFQAHFNLVIALCPNRSTDPEILRVVWNRHQQEGLTYAEYRILYPLNFSPAKARAYISLLAKEAQSWHDEGHQLIPRIVLSLSRDPNQARLQYHSIKQWQLDHPDLKAHIVGLDFCGDEESRSPAQLSSLFKEVHHHNFKSPEDALALLLHVGESFQRTHLRTAIQRVWEGCQMGAHRIGHALALGIHPNRVSAETQAREPCDNLHSHVMWLKKNRRSLLDGGYQRLDSDLKKYEHTLHIHAEPDLQSEYNDDIRESLLQLQQAVLSSQQIPWPVIESCPTSNQIIGQLEHAHHHPLPVFLRAGWPAVIGADDPGIFCTTLAKEADICRNDLGLNNEILNDISRLAKICDSRSLAKTPSTPLSSPKYSW